MTATDSKGDGMTNTNCLEGIQCPECESDGPFRIDVKTTALVYDSGVEEHTDNEWDAKSRCQCVMCGHGGTVGKFSGAELVNSEGTEQEQTMERGQ